MYGMRSKSISSDSPASAAVDKALLDYLFREKLYQHAEFECNRQLNTRKNGASLLLWHAIATGLSGDVQLAIRELETIRYREEIQYAAIAALLHFHRKSKVVDREAVDGLEAALNMCAEMSTENAILEGAKVVWYLDENSNEARLLVGKLNLPTNGDAKNSFQSSAFMLRGWIDMGPNELEELQHASMQFFLKAAVPNDLDFCMAKAKYQAQYSRNEDRVSACMNELNLALSLQPNFWPALIEKGHISASVGDWIQSKEIATRVLNADPKNLPALKLLALCVLGGCVNSSRVLHEVVGDVYTALAQLEPRNPAIFYATSRCYARICSRDRLVLEWTIKMMLNAIRIEDNAQYYEELGYQYRLLGQYSKAIEAYQHGAKLENSSCIGAIQGQIYCQIQEGQYEDAVQQLEFLSVLQESVHEVNADIDFIHALRSARHSVGLPNVSPELLLNKCVDSLKIRKSLFPIFDPYSNLFEFNPEFRIEIAHEYVSIQSSETSRKLKSGHIYKALELLEEVEKKVPGVVEARLLSIRTLFEMGDIAGGGHKLGECLAAFPSNSQVYLLKAQVEIIKNDFSNAEHSLEEAVCCDFNIRSSPLYLLYKAQIQSYSGYLDEAMNSLRDALSLPGVRESSSSTYVHISNSHRAAIFIEAIRLCSKLGDKKATQEFVEEAQSRFRNSPEEVRILIALCELEVEKGDFEKAVAILETVPSDSSLFESAQMMKADIYLTYRRDRKSYADCYREMVRKLPSAWTYMKLGEALLRVQTPLAAIDAFECALQLDPEDSAVISKLAKALIAVHNYKRAIDHIKSALRRSPTNFPAIRLDLGKLLMKLQRYEESESVLEQAVNLGESSTNAQPTAELKDVVQVLIILAEVKVKMSNKEGALEVLQRAKTVQQIILNRSRLESGRDELNEQDILADLYKKSACIHKDTSADIEKAMADYREALSIHPNHIGSLLGLAHLSLARSNLDECQKLANAAIELDKNCADAAFLLAEVFFLHSELEKAIDYYALVLNSQPNNYKALSELIGMLRRAGQLNKCISFIDRATRGGLGEEAYMHPGFHYCKGLYKRYSGSIQEAVLEFNLGRRDVEWGYDCIIQLVKIYLAPKGDTHNEVTQQEVENIQTAKALLIELSRLQAAGKRDVRIVQVLEGYVSLAFKSKESIEASIQIFSQVIDSDKDYLPALLGLSKAFVLKDDLNKARNTLKSVARMKYNSDFADEFENSYLILSELYVEKDKFDLAKDLCRRCLSVNKSCLEAWEIMGLMMEREGSYADAADCYQKSWILSEKKNPTVGYKLGFNYLKSGRAVDAIDVCGCVLGMYPGYPKIRDEILLRAQLLLRP